MKDMILAFLSRYKSFRLPVLAIVISLPIVIFVVVPQLLNYLSTNSQIEDLKKRTEFLQSKAQTLNNVDVNSYKDNLNVTLIALPDQKDLPATISQIQTLLSRNKLQLTGINLYGGGTPAGGDIQSYQIKVDVVGDNSSLRSFVSDLRKAPEIMKLGGLDLTGNKAGFSQATLTLAVYYQAAPTTLGSVEQPIKGLSPAEIQLISQLQSNLQKSPIVTSNPTVKTGGAKGKDNPFQ